MNILTFDTSTEMMSVAVLRSADGADPAGLVPRIWEHTGPGGPQTSATLIPVIQQLMVQADLQFGQLDAIGFGCGPGSFTGLRTACAVAQGLAFGAHVPVLPIDTLLAVAEEARYQYAAGLDRYQVVALLDARMDEMYTGRYAFKSGQWTQIGGYNLIHPEDLVWEADWPLAGNVFAAYGERLGTPSDLACVAPRLEVRPTATAMLRLAPGLLATGGAVRADQALPLYIRDKVAKTTLERAAEKAAL
jgi:tRNA threonylcarbamoyladenosine biosynthesis protein TsaB